MIGAPSVDLFKKLNHLTIPNTIKTNTDNLASYPSNTATKKL